MRIKQLLPARLPLRARLLTAFGAMIALLLVVGWVAGTGHRIALEGFASYIDAAQESNAVQDLRRRVVELQRNVLIYRDTANPGVAERTASLGRELRKDVATLQASTQNEVRKGLLSRMQRRIQEYEENFEAVVEGRTLRRQLVQVNLPEIHTDLLGELESLARNPVDRSPAPEPESISAVRESILLARMGVLEFLNSPDSVHVSETKSVLNDAIQLAESDPLLEPLAPRLREYESKFLLAVQTTRGYLFQVNVVMAGAADEFLRLSVELDEFTEDGLAQVHEEALGRFDKIAPLGTLIIVIAVGLSLILTWGITRSITQPIGRITEVMSKLAQGESVEQIPGMNRADEIGAMAQAADVFRLTNQRTQSLLKQTQEFVELQDESNRRLEEEVQERKLAEERLKRNKTELERSNEELGQFAYVASHDLQEPLRMVTSYMQLLEAKYEKILDEQGKEFLGFAVDGAKRMKVLINSLLEYSRVGASGSAIEPIRADETLDRALHDLQIAIDEAGATIERDSLPEVYADDTQLEQLFENLIGNAIKFSKGSKPVIRIQAAREGNQVRFTVSDNGIGFDCRYADKIFVIFQRLQGRHEYEGTGLGLAICKKIVSRHGGRIWADSTPGKGASFHFTLNAAAQGRGRISA